MSKTSQCIELLKILYGRNKLVSVNELADSLGTNPRNIPEYVRELREIGYDIITVPGRYGGYMLDRHSTFPVLKLTEEEKRILQISSDYITANEDFLDAKLYQRAISKVFASTSAMPTVDETVIIPGVTLLMSGEDLRKRHSVIEDCIKRKRKISIDFLSNDNIVRNRVIHPYKLFMFNNAWFVIGFCESVNGVRVFKLNRIERYNVLSDKFRVLLSYNESDYFDEKGLKQGKDWSDSENLEKQSTVHIKLQLKGRPAMYVKEYKYGENQIITPIDKDTTILECDMRYKYNTIKFVLGFGTDCEVLEPLWLKDEVKRIAKEMSKE